MSAPILPLGVVTCSRCGSSLPRACPDCYAPLVIAPRFVRTSHGHRHDGATAECSSCGKKFEHRHSKRFQAMGWRGRS